MAKVNLVHICFSGWYQLHWMGPNINCASFLCRWQTYQGDIPMRFLKHLSVCIRHP